MKDRRQVFSHAAATLALVLGLAGCDSGPREIRFGQDECAECKMTIVDRHYCAELITGKGKVFMFDDIGCLLAFRQRAEAPVPEPRVFVVDFSKPGTLIAAGKAVFLHHENLRSPMAGGFAAFSNEADLQAARTELGGGGRILRWPEVVNSP